MIVFFFYIAAILAVFTFCAIVADFSLWLQERKQAEADVSLEDAQAAEGKGS